MWERRFQALILELVVVALFVDSWVAVLQLLGSPWALEPGLVGVGEVILVGWVLVRFLEFPKRDCLFSIGLWKVVVGADLLIVIEGLAGVAT